MIIAWHDIELIAEPQLFNFLTNKENNSISWEYQPNTDYVKYCINDYNCGYNWDLRGV